MSLLPTQAPPPILSAQNTFRHRGPPLGTGASSRRHRDLLSAAQGLLWAAQGLLSAAEGPPLGGTGPPLSGTRASSRYRDLPQSPQQKGVGPFGTVSRLPTQGPPSILSAQRTVPTSIEGLLSAQGPPPDTGASSNPLSTEDLPAQKPPPGTGASSRRHRGLLSAAQGPPLSGTEGLLSAQGPPFGSRGASSRRYGASS